MFQLGYMFGIGCGEYVERRGIFDLASQLRGGCEAEYGMNASVGLKARAETLEYVRQVGGRCDGQLGLRLFLVRAASSETRQCEQQSESRHASLSFSHDSRNVYRTSPAA